MADDIILADGFLVVSDSEEIIPENMKTTLPTREKNNACLESNEFNSKDIHGPYTSFKESESQYLANEDKLIEPNYNIVNTLSDDINANSDRTFEALAKNSEKEEKRQENTLAKDLSDTTTDENDFFTSLRLNSPVDLDVHNMHDFDVDHVLDITREKICNEPELSNAIDTILMKNQEMESDSCSLSKSLEFIKVENQSKKSPGSFIIGNDFDSESDNDSFSPLLPLIDIVNSSLTESDKTKLDFKSIKPCSVVLQKCDSLVKDISNDITRTDLEHDDLEVVSEANEILSENVKSKRGRKRGWRKDLNNTCASDISNDITRTDLEHDDLVVSEANETFSENVKSKRGRKKGRRKDSNNTCVSDISNDVTHSVLEHDDLEIISKANEILSENVQSIRGRKKGWRKGSNKSSMNNISTYGEDEEKTCNVGLRKRSLSSGSDTSEKNSVSLEMVQVGYEQNNMSVKVEEMYKSNLEFEENQTNYTDTEHCENDNLSNASDISFIKDTFHSQAAQLDLFSLIKPCHVALGRMQYDIEKKYASSSSNEQSSELCNLSESSDLDCGNERRVTEKTSTFFIIGSDQCEDSRNKWKIAGRGNSKKRSDPSELSSTEPEDILSETTNSEKSAQDSSKVEKRIKQMELILNAVIQELKELKTIMNTIVKNEVVQELKELKTLMKSTEKKVDTLLKLHD